MFRNQTMQRSVAAVVLTTFLSLSLYPFTAAAQAKEAVEKAGLLPQQNDEGVIGNAERYFRKLSGTKKNSRLSSDERFSQLLAEIHDDLKAAVPEVALPKEAKQHAKGKFIKSDSATKTKQIRAKRSELKQLYVEIEESFQDTEQHLKNAKVPQVILDRHNEAVAQFQVRKAEFEKWMDKLEKADDANDSIERQASLEALGSFMAKHPNAKAHQYTDPNRLPFRTSDGNVRKPYETKDEYQASLFPPKYGKVLLASTSLDGVKLVPMALPSTPAAEDLAETDDVQITPAIRDLANQLEKNPVKIYQWVRNNIEFIPSYGSIQGSNLTLQNKRGNAFDTANLLIALYRAAGVPARYVYGTIEVPADKVMNWMGGVTKPEAAQSLLGQGGIPNVALVSGGVVRAIRMEHVWVEAHVDYHPSRAAINRSPNAWVPMDASFKQYQFTQGMDIKANVLINRQTLLDQIKQGGTINEAEGWVQNLNAANLQNQLAVYQDQVKGYINSQKLNATVGDVLGTQKIIEQNHRILLGSLPYKTVATGDKFQALPDRLKWRFKTNIYAGGWYGDSNSPYIEINQPTAKLAGKKITLSFLPATQADMDLINSYVPKPHADGTPIQPSELPASLPGYLIKVKAEFRIDGQMVAQTVDQFTMGSEVRQSNQYFNPSKGRWEGGEDNDITAGEYNAIAVDLQGIGVQQLRDHQAKLDTIRSKLMLFQQNPSDTTSIEGLTKEELTGNLLHSGILAYFGRLDMDDKLVERSFTNVISYRLPSYGRFFSAVQTQYWFGLPRNVSFPGVVMDVDYLFQHAEAKEADDAIRASFVRQTGFSASAAEHAIPEALFRASSLPADHPSQPQGVSAVKALAVAAAQGQRIYMLNNNNEALHNSILQQLQISQDVKSEIANALATGKEVTVHDKDINIGGWIGSGYLILDPDTGAGAYKIAGGANGGYLVAQGGMALFGLIQLVNILARIGPLLGLALVSGPVGAALMLLVGIVTLIGALMADNPYTATDVSRHLTVITTLAAIGSMLAIVAPILFVLVYVALLLYIASILIAQNEGRLDEEQRRRRIA